MGNVCAPTLGCSWTSGPYLIVAIHSIATHSRLDPGCGRDGWWRPLHSIVPVLFKFFHPDLATGLSVDAVLSRGRRPSLGRHLSRAPHNLQPRSLAGGVETPPPSNFPKTVPPRVLGPGVGANYYSSLSPIRHPFFSLAFPTLCMFIAATFLLMFLIC
mgnify:CR=1